MKAADIFDSNTISHACSFIFLLIFPALIFTSLWTNRFKPVRTCKGEKNIGLLPKLGIGIAAGILFGLFVPALILPLLTLIHR